MSLKISVVESGLRIGVSEISLSQFRNYAEEKVDLSPGINLISGANAQGKTNLLEAIHLLSTTRLMRGQRDAECVREGEARAKVEARLVESGTEIAMQIEPRTRKKGFLNGVGLPRASDIIGRLPAVCFAASSLPIVRGEPSDRRFFLDMELSQLHPAYLQHLTVYKRALEQRNALLRVSIESPQPAEHFEVWEQELAVHGARMRQFRTEFVSQLTLLAADVYCRLSSRESFKCRYEPKDAAADEHEFVKNIQSERAIDIQRGATMSGPHRDNLSIDIEDRDARNFSSQGQQRSAVIALKIAALRLATAHLGAPPVLLLDDVFSDLDASRREELLGVVVDEGGQVLLTCTEPGQAGANVLDHATLFEVREGSVLRQ